MSIPALSTTLLAEGPPDGRAVLLVGPSLGTAVAPLWRGCAAYLAREQRVIGWDLPGHGVSPPAEGPLTVADLAEAVRRLLVVAVGAPRAQITYAGVSVGGCVGLQLALDHPDALDGLAVICSAPQIGTPGGWAERAELVRRSGTEAMLEGSALRWFAPGSVERDPATTSALLTSLAEADDESYARVCEALAGFDVRPRLPEIAVPVIAIAGAHDEVAAPDEAEALARAVPTGQAHVLAHSGHLAPAEQPAEVADLLRQPARAGGTHEPAH